MGHLKSALGHMLDII